MKRLIQNEAEETISFGTRSSDSNTNIESGQGRMGSHLYDASILFQMDGQWESYLKNGWLL
ncbi:hypothetical protein ACT7DZ_06315 [Bacillus cereus]